MYYDHEFRIDSRDVDGQGHCRPSALLGHLQEAATRAAEAGGFGRTALTEKYRAVWVLSRIWFRLDRPLRWDERVVARTWYREGRGVMMYRDFDLYAGDRQVGEAVSLWVLLRPGDKKMLKLSTVPELEGRGGGELCKERTLSKLRMPAETVPAERRPLHYSDTDINGHVNNTRYADFACDALHLERRAPGAFVRELQIGYLAQCWPGESLELRTAREGEALLVRGEDGSGAPRFDASLILSTP